LAHGERTVDPPTAGSTLLAIGGIFVVIGGLVFAYTASGFTNPSAPPTANASVRAAVPVIGEAADLGIVSGIIGVILGILMIASAAMINTTEKKKIRLWSIIGLAASILSITSLGGLLIGMVFGILGSVIGLTVKEY
jgi:hypothetical protein